MVPVCRLFAAALDTPLAAAGSDASRHEARPGSRWEHSRAAWRAAGLAHWTAREGASPSHRRRPCHDELQVVDYTAGHARTSLPWQDHPHRVRKLCAAFSTPLPPAHAPRHPRAHSTFRAPVSRTQAPFPMSLVGTGDPHPSLSDTQTSATLVLRSAAPSLRPTCCCRGAGCPRLASGAVAPRALEARTPPPLPCRPLRFVP